MILWSKFICFKVSAQSHGMFSISLDKFLQCYMHNSLFLTILERVIKEHVIWPTWTLLLSRHSCSRISCYCQKNFEEFCCWRSPDFLILDKNELHFFSFFILFPSSINCILFQVHNKHIKNVIRIFLR